MPRGVITFVFDDGYEKVFNIVPPLLEKHGMRGVFGITIDETKIEKTEHCMVTSWREWIKLKNRGHEIAAHGITHRNLTLLNTHSLVRELQEPASLLGATTVFYPGGAVDDRVILYAKRFYSAGRTVQYGIENIPPINPFRLKSYNFSVKNFSVIKANMLALWAWLTDSWIIETYHMIGDEHNGIVHFVKTSDLTQHIRFVSRLPVKVKTIREVCPQESGKFNTHQQ